MKFKGVRVDIEAAHKLKERNDKRRTRLIIAVKKETGLSHRYGPQEVLHKFLINFLYLMKEQKNQMHLPLLKIFTRTPTPSSTKNSKSKRNK
jgi:hypothetical protein